MSVSLPRRQGHCLIRLLAQVLANFGPSINAYQEKRKSGGRQNAKLRVSGPGGKGRNQSGLGQMEERESIREGFLEEELGFKA